MKYIGNFLDWINEQHIIDHLTNCQGDKTPVWQPDRWKGNSTLEKFTEMARPGYSNNNFFFHQLNPKSKEMQDFKFLLPSLPEQRANVNWWFVMLYPGEFQAMHIDPQLTEVKNFVRYTMFLQDWEPGHIFVWDNKYIADYKAGDMYEWSNPMTVHGPANIGYHTRYTLQITLYD
jgi:hypothetical protein